MKQFISTAEAAKILRVTSSYITALARGGKLLYVYKHRRGGYQFTRGALEKYIWEEKRGLKGILEFPIMRKIIEKVGSDIGNFFGEEPGCVICDIPGGFLHAITLLFYLNEKQKDVTFVCMGKGAGSWRKESLDGRKILLVDDFSRTGKTLVKMEQVLREKCKKANIKIKEVKTFVYDKFDGNPNFSIRDSYEEHLGDIDIQLE